MCCKIMHLISSYITLLSNILYFTSPCLGKIRNKSPSPWQDQENSRPADDHHLLLLPKAFRVGRFEQPGYSRFLKEIKEFSSSQYQDDDSFFSHSPIILPCHVVPWDESLFELSLKVLLWTPACDNENIMEVKLQVQCTNRSGIQDSTFHVHCPP